MRLGWEEERDGEEEIYHVRLGGELKVRVN